MQLVVELRRYREVYMMFAGAAANKNSVFIQSKLQKEKINQFLTVNTASQIVTRNKTRSIASLHLHISGGSSCTHGCFISRCCDLQK